ncbi:GNAT family N-acetyltransferase [Providencia sp. SKLX074055]|uniref:GNAT family N-acetyltransferase n=1 Tax=Providencia xihuensis TaxID=3342830 RepID=UPI0035C036A1
MKQIVLKTTRLQLVPLNEKHLQYQIDLGKDPKVMMYLDGPQTAEASEKEFTDSLTRAKRGLGCWAGFMDGEFVGFWILCVPYEIESTTVKIIPYGDDTAELGYILASKFWRQGLGKEGAIALVRYGFETLNLLQIISRTDVNSIASQATMISAGLQFKRRFKVTTGEGIEFHVSKEEWNMKNKEKLS